jgi:hypothetical protein
MTCLYATQAFPESELSECHAKELIPRGKASALSWHGIIGYASLKLLPVDGVADLSKYDTGFVHNEILLKYLTINTYGSKSPP